MNHLENTRTKIHMDDPLVLTRLTDTLTKFFEHKNPGWGRPTLILCIGTDRSTGDSLGPLVGTRLQNMRSELFEVYGTLDSPVHASNLVEILDKISEQYQSPFIVAVDACLGRLESVGHISISPGPLHPGAGVNKKLPPVGEVNISGIVNVGGYMEFMVLQNTRLSVVMKMANLIASTIFYTATKLNKFSSWPLPVEAEVFPQKENQIQTG